MKVFIIGGRKSQEFVKYNNQVASQLESLGHTVDFSQIKASRELDVQHFEGAFKRNLLSIKKADFVVVEASEMSSGIGYLIGLALNEKKPVLALFNRSTSEKPSITLKGGANSGKLFTYKEYTEDILSKVLNEYLNKIKKQLDTKFILIISPEIDRYLEWASENRRMHKAQVVRSALEDIMEKDKEYKNAMKNS